MMVNDFELRCGFPENIHHDMGREFENQLMAQLQNHHYVHRYTTNRASLSG